MEFLKYGTGWAIAIVFGLASLYYFRYGKRKKTLMLDVSAQRLVAHAALSHGLVVSFNNDELREPYLLEFAVKNTGDKDVASKDFDADKPVKIDLGSAVKVVTLIDESLDETRPLQAKAGGRIIEILPSKIAASDEMTIQILLDGRPELSLAENPILDSKIVFGEQLRWSDLRKFLRQSVVGIVVSGLGLAAMIGLYFNHEALSITPTDWWMTGPLWTVIIWTVSVVLAVSGIVFSTYALSRAGARLRKLK